MRTYMKIFSPLILLFTCSICFSQEPDSTELNSGLIYGKDHLFGLTAPKGWVLDNSSGVSQGLHAVFYPKGGSWEHSPSVMYANTASKKVQGNETLEKLIAYDVSQYKRSHKPIEVVESPDILTGDEKKAVVRYFYFSNYEAVAYINEEKTVTLIVLSSNSKAEFERSLTPFRELVGSYKFLSTDVRIEE
jgi:hypothetical protein